MSKEVFQLVGEMDREDLQTQLALQCAPLLMGIKMSNLLIVPNRNVLDVYELFKDTCISVELIYMSEQKTMFLLYRREELDIYLESATTKEVMELFGYRGMTPVEIRRELIHRYEKYAEGNGMFPHEMKTRVKIISMRDTGKCMETSWRPKLFLKSTTKLRNM